MVAAMGSAGKALGEGIAKMKENRDGSRAADGVMDQLQKTNPELFPKGADGQMDASFLEKFYAAPLKGKQQQIGLLVSKIMTPEDQAKIGLINAQTGVANAQTGAINQQTGNAAAVTANAANFRSQLGKYRAKRTGAGTSSATNAATNGAGNSLPLPAAGADPLPVPQLWAPPPLGMPQAPQY